MSPYRFRPTLPVFPRFLVCVSLLALALLWTPARASVLRVEETPKAVPLASYLEFLPDAAAQLTIDQAASPARAERYRPLSQGVPREYSGPVWLRLSLARAASPGGTEEDSRLLLDLGRDLPGTTRLFSMRASAPGGDARLWQSEDSSAHVIFSLPSPGLVPATVYLRLDGPPSPWFSPTLQAAAFHKPASLPMDLLLPALLAAALIMSLLRAMREQAQWRIWAALLTGAALLQALFPAGAAVGPVSPKMLCALLSPGFMLMLLPHVGRHLLQTPQHATGPDLFLRLLPALGAALALAPLAPGLAWLGRYLALWPVLLLPLFLVAMACLSRRLPGALAFFAACLAPVLGVAASFLELANATPPLLGASGHVWGMAFGCLALALASSAREEAAAECADEAWTEKTPGLVLHDDCRPETLDRLKEERDKAASGTDAEAEPPARESETLPLGAPASVFQASEAQRPILDFTPPWDASTSKAAAQDPDADDTARSFAELSRLTKEKEEPCAEFGSLAGGSLLAPCPNPEAPSAQLTEIKAAGAEALHAEPAATPSAETEPAAPPADLPLPEKHAEQTPPQPQEPKPWSLPPMGTQTGKKPVFSAVETPKPDEPVHSVPEKPLTEATEPASAAPLSASFTVAEPLPAPVSVAEPLPAPEPAAAVLPQSSLDPLAEEHPPAEEKRLFDLFRLLKETHAAVEDLAEEKGLGLSWHVSPHIAQYYEGEDELLGEALTLLLRGAVRATARGTVELTVRGLPANADPGHLVFALSIRGGGAAIRPWDLTAVGRIWALADRCGGFFSLDHTQDGDMSVVFSMHFALPGAEGNLEAEQALVLESLPDQPLPEQMLPGQRLPGQSLSDQALPEPDLEPLSLAPSPAFSAFSVDGAQPLAPGLQPLAVTALSLEEEQEAGEQEPWLRERIILADMAAGSRRLRAQYLSDLPHTLLEADSVASALALYGRSPSGLVIFDADMPETDIAAAIAELRRLEAARSLPRTATLALTAHDLQSERLRASGCDAALVKPFTRELLQEAVLALAPHEDSSEGRAPVEEKTPSTPGQAFQSRLAPPSMPEAAPAAAQLAESELVALGLDPKDLMPPQAETLSPAAPAREPEPERAPAAPPSGEAEAPSAAVRELPLLDLIITDIDPDREEEESRETPAPVVAPSPVAVTVRQEPASLPALEKQPEAPRVSAPRPAPVVVRVRPPAPRAAIQESPPGPAPAAPEAPPVAPEAPAQPKTPESQPVVRITSRDPKPNKLPLPGLNDSVYADMLPFAPGLIYTLSDMIKDAQHGQEEKSCLLVQDAAERLSGKAAAFGLENLERVARCVERAAAADDAEAVAELLGELVALTERYKEALRACHRDTQ